MFWLLNSLLYPYPRSKYIWARVRMRYETEKVVRRAHHPSSFDKLRTNTECSRMCSNHPERSRRTLLVLYKGTKIWVPKSRIDKIKLRKGSFWIYVQENSLF